MSKYEKFKDASMLRCPVCKFQLHLREKSLACDNRHSFDIAKQGYVNLLTGGKPINEYTKVSFQERQQILEKGGLTATVRRTLGGDIDASCGQLRRKYTKETNS